ncbi:MAG: hypothetical protein KBE65_12470 [Phycisphaerae bacterium]|nr:hypothetical protein [Phycisphaerae bacterium]
MIQTLRITGVAAVAFAGVILASLLGPVSLIRLDDSRNEKMDKIITAPGAVDRFQSQHTGDDQVGPDTTPPLVKQAESFKDIIDPPAPPVAEAPKAPPTGRGTTTAKSPPAGSQKFTLLGTSYSPSNPGSSFAYIRFVDNTCQWVECGSEVGHDVIKEIREDSIVCSDGRRDTVLFVEVVPDRVSLLEADGEVLPSDAAATPEPIEVRAVDAPPSRPRMPNRVAPHGAGRLTLSEQGALGDLASSLKKLRGVPGEGVGADANRAAAVERLISEFKSSRVSPEEARNLENLSGETTGESERGPEPPTREFIRKLNTARPPKD